METINIQLSTHSKILNDNEKLYLDFLGESVDVLLGRFESIIKAGYDISELMYFSQYVVTLLFRHSNLESEEISRIENEFLYIHLFFEAMDQIAGTPDLTAALNAMSVNQANRMNQYKDAIQYDIANFGLNSRP